MKKTNWLAVTLVSIVTILFLFWVGTLIGGGYGGYGMMGNRGYGGHMSWGYSPFSWLGMGFGMIIMWLIPIGIIALFVYGIIALTRNTSNPVPSVQHPCPNCGKGVQADWQNCPYCGTKL